MLDAEQPDRIVVARNGSPIVLGIGEKEMFVASDVAALVRYTRQVVHLEDGELATVRAEGFRTFTEDARPTTRQPSIVDWEIDAYDTAGALALPRQGDPRAARRDRAHARGRLDERFSTAHLGGLNLDARELRDIRRVKILGCGSAYYAGQMGAQLIEELARIPADAEPASEFRYRNPVIEADTLYVAVSQSGETYDTLAAVQEVRRKGGRVLGRGEHRRQRHRARVRRRDLPARRAGDLGRLHQGVHLHRGRLRAARAALRPGPRPLAGRREADHRGARGAARPDPRDPGAGGGDRRAGRASTRSARA